MHVWILCVALKPEFNRWMSFFDCTCKWLLMCVVWCLLQCDSSLQLVASSLIPRQFWTESGNETSGILACIICACLLCCSVQNNPLHFTCVIVDEVSLLPSVYHLMVISIIHHAACIHTPTYLGCPVLWAGCTGAIEIPLLKAGPGWRPSSTAGDHSISEGSFPWLWSEPLWEALQALLKAWSFRYDSGITILVLLLAWMLC